MKLNELLLKVSTLKRGVYTKAKWQSTDTKKGVEYKKVSQGVVRLVKYSHINGVEVKNKPNLNEKCLLSDTIYYNSNTNNHYIQLATTNTKNHKPKSTYYINGVEVDKETFEQDKKPNNTYNQRVVFRVKIDNLLEIGN